MQEAFICIIGYFNVGNKRSDMYGKAKGFAKS